MTNPADDNAEGAPHPDWPAPLPKTLPKPTLWPAVLAFGACFLAWGILTSWLVSATGFVLFLMGCAGWIADLRRGGGPE
jgi:hypothetical protein